MRVEVASPIAGRVERIERGVGEQLDEGDAILILESMKMEVPIEASCAGCLVELRVAEGEQVAEGTVLAVIE